MPTPSDRHGQQPEPPHNWAPTTSVPKRSVFRNYPAAVPDASSPDADPASDQAGHRHSTGSDAPHRTPSPSDPSSVAPSTAAGSDALPLQAAIDHAMARAFVYRFIAKCFEDPTPGNWAALTDPATQLNLTNAVRALDAGNGSLSTAVAGLVAALVPAERDAFTDAYLVTFGHAARGPCPMNEIEYGGMMADSLFQPHRLADLRAFYRAFGLDLAEDAGERPDHICIELEFLSVLAAKEAYALEHQLDAELLAVVRDAQRSFLREHLGQWAPAFTRRLEREAGQRTLVALARFTREFILSECARCRVTPGSEDLLLRPVDEAAESLCNSCGITALPPGALTTT